MNALDRRLRAYGKSSMPKPDESKIKDTVVSARKNFYQSVEQTEVSYFDFIYDQTRYIRKKWWILQFFLLLSAGCLIRGTEDVRLLQRLLGTTAPLFVILVIPELWKNRSSGSMEIEAAARFSLRQIYAARLLVFAVVDGMFLGIFAAALSLTSGVMIGEIVIQFFLPVIVTCCICFRTLCSRYADSEYTACFLSLLWAAVWVQVVLNESVYEAVSVPAWAGICGIAVLYLTYIVKRVMRECENGLEGGCVNAAE
ncbi:MAG: hypothetical protein NC341_03665 [Blautia sp.]|nr:hypothetical protein [Blautia sp.]MCM1200695.1 hypothetical protein [Bacteroides fragilis]